MAAINRLADDDFTAQLQCKHLQDTRKACTAVCRMLAPQGRVYSLMYRCTRTQKGAQKKNSSPKT